jgi:hypothetical protein
MICCTVPHFRNHSGTRNAWLGTAATLYYPYSKLSKLSGTVILIELMVFKRMYKPIDNHKHYPVKISTAGFHFSFVTFGNHKLCF